MVCLEERELRRFWLDRGSSVMSPGALSGICGVSRQTIYDWAHAGLVRAWSLYRGEFYVHIGDAVRHAVKVEHNVSPDWKKEFVGSPTKGR